MRTKFRLILVLALLAAMLATATSSAFAASSPTLLGESLLSGKGLVLYFSMPSDFDLSQANGSVTVDGVTYPLDCHFNTDGILVCVAGGVKKKDIGLTAAIVLGGTDFETVVPEATYPPGTYNPCPGYTYNVYDPFWLGYIGTYDQACPASVGDMITYYSPNVVGDWIYMYSLDGSDACWANYDWGNGYYFLCN